MCRHASVQTSAGRSRTWCSSAGWVSLLRKVLSTPPGYERAVVEASRTAAPRAVGAIAAVIHGQPWPPMRCWSDVEAAPRSSRPAASATCSNYDGSGYPTCTTCSGRSRRRSSTADCASRSASACSPTDRSRGRSTSPKSVLSRRGCAPKRSRLSRYACSIRTPPLHERASVAAILRSELAGAAVSTSAEILREQGEYERTATTAVNAYIRPLMGRTSTGFAAALTIAASTRHS